MDDLLHPLAVNRQRGLALELSAIANNVANLSTAGYRREQNVFAEFVASSGHGESLSMAHSSARFASELPGDYMVTGRKLDMAIRGAGFFLVAGADGPLLTRNGAFAVSADNRLIDRDGRAVLDAGGAEIFLPSDAADIAVGEDGSVAVDGEALGQLAVVAAPSETLSRAGSMHFRSSAALEPVAAPRLEQRVLEGSNVDPVQEIARMIDVTRSYERVQALIEDEDERIGNVIETLGRAS